MYLKKGDSVMIMAGKDKGKEGIITSVLKDKNKVIVENLNISMKHQKAGYSGESGIVEKEMGIDASNVMLIDPSTKKPTRIKNIVKDGKKIRVSAKTNEEI